MTATEEYEMLEAVALVIAEHVSTGQTHKAVSALRAMRRQAASHTDTDALLSEIKLRGVIAPDEKCSAFDTHRSTSLKEEYLDVLMNCMTKCGACGAAPNIPCEHARRWKWEAD